MDDNSDAMLDEFTKVITIPSADGAANRSYQVAGAGARALAGLTDLVLQVITFAGLVWLAFRFRPDLFPRESWVWLVPVGFLEWHIVYLMLCESFTRGATPGKQLWRLRVISIDGQVPRSIMLVLRNVARVLDIFAGAYLAALAMVAFLHHRQRIGDHLAKTIVIYNIPLAQQLLDAEVPESLYSTSEDGYLLESWVKRERRMEPDSRLASALDLAVYLREKYDPNAEQLPDPSQYLRHLYDAEHAPPSGGGDEDKAK